MIPLACFLTTKFPSSFVEKLTGHRDTICWSESVDVVGSGRFQIVDEIRRLFFRFGLLVGKRRRAV
jgi:hypothetical protein